MLTNQLDTKQAIATFWKWFTENQKSYLEFTHDTPNLQSLIQELADNLKSIHPDLTFEFSHLKEGNVREFVLSADGLRGLVDVVQELVRTAPALPNWQIIAFRQPKPAYTRIGYRGWIIDLNNCWYKAAPAGHKLDLQLFVRDLPEDRALYSGLFLMLDVVLGEYDTIMHVGALDFHPFSEENQPTLLPLALLAEQMRKFKDDLGLTEIAHN